jgi:ABC-type antimicrobial peptide transport system permease subunit
MAVEFEPLPMLVANTIRRQELGMTLMMMFGVAAVLLAAVGIYGVVAYAAAQRRGEMATRLALGAAPGQIFWIVLKHGAVLAAVGTVVGLGAAYFAGRLVSSWIYAVNAADPMILGAATLLVVAIALLATTIPAFRASRLNPAGVLRPD